MRLLPRRLASPITGKSGKRKIVLARYVHNNRLRDALDGRAFTAFPAPAPTTTSSAAWPRATMPPCASSPAAHRHPAPHATDQTVWSKAENCVGRQRRHARQGGARTSASPSPVVRPTPEEK